MAAPKLNLFLAAFLKRLQEAENGVFQVMTSRLLGFAVGVNLDLFGRVVGQARNGQTDDAYRKSIRLRIYINGSRGRPEDLIYVARQLTGFQTIQYLDIPTALGGGGNCRIIIPGWPGDDGSLLAFLQSLCPAGVRLINVTAVYPPNVFRMKDKMGTRLYHD